MLNARAQSAARLRLIFDGLLKPGRPNNAFFVTSIATRGLVSSRNVCDNANTISWTTPGTDDSPASGLAVQDIVGSADQSSSLSSSSADARRQPIFFYVDTVFPLKLGIWDVRYALAEVEKENLLERIKQRIPKDTGHSFRVEAIEARQKDGGAFVRCSYIPDEKAYAGQEDTSLRDLSRKVITAYNATAERPWYSWKPSEAHLVKGRPWREDILNRFPSSTLRVEFESGPELSQEQVYAIFRPYGRIRDLEPQPASNKDIPRFANVTYTRTRSAAAARNCLYGYKFTPGTDNNAAGASTPTVLRILYKERTKGGRAATDWMTNHPRIVIPILAVLVGSLSYAIFDPIRAFFIKCKVSALFDLERYRLTRWLKKETIGRLGALSSRTAKETEDGRADQGLNGATGIENERRDAAEKLKMWLTDMPDTFITITGPAGSGKQALVSSVTTDAKNVLYIDCAEIVKQARGGAGGAATESKIVSALATQLGYYPQFAWAASFSNLVDIASVGLIGTKAGFATNLDVQIKQVLDVAATALKSLAEEARASRKQGTMLEKQRVELLSSSPAYVQNVRNGNIHDGRLDCLAGGGIMAELGMGLEPQPVEKDLSLPPALLPPIEDVKGSAQSASEALNAAADDDNSPPASNNDGYVALPTPPSKGQGAGLETEAPSTYSQVWGPYTLRRALQATLPDEPDGGRSSTTDIDNMPIVVIRGFEASHGKNYDVLWAGMADWAATLVENRIAHCIFINDSVAVSRSLARALPSKAFDSIALTDATSENALQYVRQKLAEFGKEDLANNTSEVAIARLGGRLTDLETLIQKMRGGAETDEAIQDIIQRSAVEITKNCFGDDADEAKSLAWTREQAWYIIKTLAKEKEMSYPILLADGPFKDGEKALRALEQADVISLQHKDGHAGIVRPGKPSYKAAFEILANNPIFAAQNELALNAKASTSANSAIKAASEDLINLSQLFSRETGKWIFSGSHTIPVEVAAKVDEALSKMHKAQNDLARLSSEAAELKAKLKRV